ncbi:MAG: four helix bundle protein [Gemmatimonadota bacterium]
MHPFQKLEVCGQAHAFALDCYSRAQAIADRSIRWQLQRAAQSIPANLVEGAGSQSQAAFGRYIAIAIASAKESEYHLLFARDAGLLPAAAYEELARSINNLTPRLVVLLATVRRNAERRTKR